MSNKIHPFLQSLIDQPDENFNQMDKKSCYKMMANYTRPNSFSGTISWIAFRVWNAIKSIFGKSDFQIQRNKFMLSFQEVVPFKQAKRISSKITNLLIKMNQRMVTGKFPNNPNEFSAYQTNRFQKSIGPIIAEIYKTLS